MGEMENSKESKSFSRERKLEVFSFFFPFGSRFPWPPKPLGWVCASAGPVGSQLLACFPRISDHGNNNNNQHILREPSWFYGFWRGGDFPKKRVGLLITVRGIKGSFGFHGKFRRADLRSSC